METFQSLFTHKGIYTFPDGTPIVALWTVLNDRPRWWFVEQQGRRPGRYGELEIVVYPNGAIYTLVPTPNRENPDICIPVPSDLCIEDIRPHQEEAQISGGTGGYMEP